jgi:hypothetical protein
MIAGAIRRRQQFNILKGGYLMYKVKADQSGVPFSIAMPQVTDSEGNHIPSAQITAEVVTSDDAVLEIVMDSDTSGTLNFGIPGTASIEVAYKYSDGLSEPKILGAVGAQFVVVTGDPARVVGGAITFEGLTEESQEGGGVTPEPGTGGGGTEQPDGGTVTV